MRRRRCGCWTGSGGWALPAARLAAIGERLGADVPVCLASRPRRMQGVGEVLLPAPALPECGLLLVNPGVALPTPAVFRARGAGFTPPARAAGGLGRCRRPWRGTWRRCGTTWRRRRSRCCPPVAEVLAALRALPGCLLARMSGSGATCFGLFATPAEAAAAAAGLPAAWWRCGGRLVRRADDGGALRRAGRRSYPGAAAGA